MGILLETLKKQAKLDAEKQAKLIFLEDATVLSTESDSFDLGQKIWWKPDPATPEMGPGTIRFRKIDYKLLYTETIKQGPQMEEDLPRSFYGQIVSKVLVVFRGKEYIVVPATITKWHAHSPAHLVGTLNALDNFVYCKCHISEVGDPFDAIKCRCGQPLERHICLICGAVKISLVLNPDVMDSYT